MKKKPPTKKSGTRKKEEGCGCEAPYCVITGYEVRGRADEEGMVKVVRFLDCCFHGLQKVEGVGRAEYEDVRGEKVLIQVWKAPLTYKTKDRKAVADNQKGAVELAPKPRKPEVKKPAPKREEKPELPEREDEEPPKWVDEDERN